jgi:hypothetical protein
VAAQVPIDPAGDAIERQIDRAFELALARPASGDERQDAAELVRRFGLAALCRALLNCNEFIHLE